MWDYIRVTPEDLLEIQDTTGVDEDTLRQILLILEYKLEVIL